MTFGCFNNPAKITPAGRRGLGQDSAPVAAVPAGAEIQGDGRSLPLPAVGGDVCRPRDRSATGWNFSAASPHAELLAEYNRIDLALDPFPYSGGVTTCEALWMGVPVVTCPGETFASRHSLSHLSNMGLTETIARDLDEYVEMAVSLAGDLPRLARFARLAGADGRLAAVRREAVCRQLAVVLRGVWQER